MEPNLSSGLESTKASVYGRDYAKDLDAYYNDLNLQQTFALFSRFEYIQNAKHLADIAGIDEIDAMDRLECLKNLSLLGVNETGYFRKNSHIQQALSSDRKLRAKQHSIRLMQVASLYTEAEKYADDFVTTATSLELIKELYDKVAQAKTDFINKTHELPSEKRDHIMTFALGFLLDEITTTKGVDND